MASVRISVIIPTQRRPEPLRVAALSIIRQAGVDAATLEMVIVDNDAADSARPVAGELAKAAAFPVIYVHEPSPGVANARNAAMAAAHGAIIAFLDDDEEAPEGWLAEMLAVQARFEADVVFGPVRGRAAGAAPRHRAYFDDFFSRKGPDTTGPIERYYGCGNSLLRRAALPDPDQPFSPIRNHIGGEDDLLFAQMEKAGARFAWAADAWVWEDPLPARQTLAYTLQRAFAYGQGASARCAAASPPDLAGLAKWTVIGAGQAVVFGTVAALKSLIGAADAPLWLDRAARGLGKVFWGKPFHIEFYGRRGAT
jgi:glycosyltransferase involved in cell wall biosynthesis